MNNTFFADDHKSNEPFWMCIAWSRLPREGLIYPASYLMLSEGIVLLKLAIIMLSLINTSLRFVKLLVWIWNFCYVHFCRDQNALKNVNVVNVNIIKKTKSAEWMDTHIAMHVQPNAMVL